MPIKKRHKGKVDYELRPEPAVPTLADLGLESHGKQVPQYRGMAIRFGLRPLNTPEPHPFADWKFQLPASFWPAIRRGDFKAGDIIYSDAEVYKLPWGEALKLAGLIVLSVVRASPAVGRIEGEVTVRVQRPDGSKLVSIADQAMTQKAFAEILRTGAEPLFQD